MEVAILFADKFKMSAWTRSELLYNSIYAQTVDLAILNDRAIKAALSPLMAC